MHAKTRDHFKSRSLWISHLLPSILFARHFSISSSVEISIVGFLHFLFEWVVDTVLFSFRTLSAHEIEKSNRIISLVTTTYLFAPQRNSNRKSVSNSLIDPEAQCNWSHSLVDWCTWLGVGRFNVLKHALALKALLALMGNMKYWISDWCATLNDLKSHEAELFLARIYVTQSVQFQKQTFS